MLILQWSLESWAIHCRTEEGEKKEEEKEEEEEEELLYARAEPTVPVNTLVPVVSSYLGLVLTNTLFFQDR